MLVGGTPASGSFGKIAARVVRDTANGQTASFTIYLKDQADLTAAYGMDREARGRYVYKSLRETAERTQAPLRAMLAAQGVSYRSFWVANVIFAKGGRPLVEALADRSDVAAIETNDASNWIQGDEALGSASAPEGIEPGVSKVNAPSLWSLGYKGQGIVVGNQDTGMRWTHNALKPHYRGWNGTTADHTYSWHDSIHSSITGNPNPCNYNSPAPCDDHSHGTHTTGTAVGDDGDSNQIGVAPGAKWIGCRNMDEGTGRPQTYTECFQFFLAPGGDSTKRPDVMNNSWGCPTSELCAADTLQSVVDNSEAAGVFVEVSAGNDGPSCSTVQDPPAIYSSSFSTGAAGWGDMTLAEFSSRGPVTADGSGRMKPEIVAPGTSIRSSIKIADDAYAGNWSGTSMAGPHVVGVVALLWQARPSLRNQIAATKQVLEKSANPAVPVGQNADGCGGVNTIPNNHFGYGFVDALAAYDSLRWVTVKTEGAGSGTVTSSPSGIDCGTTCTKSFADNASVTLTASPAAGSTFTGWSGDCSGTGTCTLTMDHGHLATATFAAGPKTLTVTRAGGGGGTVTSNPAGIDCGSTCTHDFADGTSVTLTAAAAAGSSFTGWSGDCTGTGTCDLTMSASHSATATFAASPPPPPPPPPPVKCVVPKVKGKTLAAAKRAITKAHCSLGKVKRATSVRKKGTVIAQSPPPGKRLAKGSKVNVVLSRGKRSH